MQRKSPRSQIPEGFRRVHRRRVAAKIWVFTNLVVGAIGAIGVTLIEFVFAGRMLHRPWQIALIMLGVAALANVPIALRIAREYPKARYWK